MKTSKFEHGDLLERTRPRVLQSAPSRIAWMLLLGFASQHAAGFYRRNVFREGAENCARGRVRSKCSAIIILLLSFVFFGQSYSQEREPSRRELWVPTRNLDEVLRQHPNAVLLDRMQYEALIRDAGQVKPGAEKQNPPVNAVIEGVKLHADLVSGMQKLLIKATLTVNGLSDNWTELPLLALPEGVVLTKFDGSDVVLKNNSPGKGAPQTVLAVHGKGRRQMVLEFQTSLRRVNHICSAVVPLLAQPITLTAGLDESVQVTDCWLQKDGVVTMPVIPSASVSTGMNITWAEKVAASAASDAPVTQRTDCLTSIGGSGVTSFVRLQLQSTSGPLPTILKFKLADVSANVIRVDDENVSSWKQTGNTLEIARRSGFIDAVNFNVTILQAAPDGVGTTPFEIEVPKLEGAARIAANIDLAVADNFAMAGWQTPGTAPDEVFRNLRKSKMAKPEETFLTHYDVVPAKVIVNIRRRGNHFSADVDNRIAIATHDVMMDRVLAFRGEEGRVNRAIFTVPAGEQFLGLSAASGERVEWKQVEGGADTLVRDAQANAADKSVRAPSFELIWPGGLQKGQVSTLGLRTRRDLGAATGEGKGAEKLEFENLKVPEAIRLAGYVALNFDDSWKVATTDTTGLESRDARVTPVKGRMAWFTLRDHKLALNISRNESVLDAGVVAYALPRAKNIEIEGQVVLDVTRAPLRKFDVKLPVASAKLLRWDSPLIGEQTLDAATGIWHLTLRKELLGIANIRFHLSLPAEQKLQAAAGTKNEESGTKNQPTTLSAILPAFEFPAARRFTGAWVVEANTDTELSYETKGLQPMDSLQAPTVEGYAPRHRVLAAYGYGSGAHELRITAARHEPSALVGAVVNEMKITSVIGRDGVGRHEAALLVKHNGQQFFGMQLPAGAAVIGARAGGQAVKPVRAGENEVRVPLPVNQSTDVPVWVVVTYESRSSAWDGHGSAKLVPPGVGEGVPVLNTSWKVFTPDGMEVRADGGLSQTVGSPEPSSLLGQLAGYLITPPMTRKSPTVDFLPGGGADEPAMVDLKLDYPKPMFVGTPVPYQSIEGRENSRRLEVEKTQGDVNIDRAEQSLIFGKAGRISLELEVPTAGRIFEFRGNQRPDVITLRYQSWERQMRIAVIWMVLGMSLFFMLGRRRAWLTTIIVALLMTCVPLAFTPSWLTVCNAVLAGWLAGFAVWLAWRIARWVERKMGDGRWKMGDAKFAAFIFVGSACFAGSSNAEDKPDPAAHSVIVPYDPGQPRDPQRVNRFYLDYAQFQKLWELAKENRRPAKADEADSKAQPEAFINSALYDARIEDDKFVVNARLSVVSRGAKWAKLPLPFKGGDLSIAEVKLDGDTALFEKGELLIENPGTHVVEVTVQLLQKRGWISASLTCPVAPAAVLALTVPRTDGRPMIGMAVPGGNNADIVHFVSKPGLISEEKRGEKMTYTMPLGAAHDFNIRRTPGRKLVADAPPAQSESKIYLRVLPRLEKVSAQVNFTFSGTERRTLTVELDPTLQPESVSGISAAQVTLRKDGGRQFLDVHFDQAVADGATMGIQAERVFEAATGNRTAPVVLGSALRRSSVVEVQSSNDLQIKPDATGVERVGVGSFRVTDDKTLRYAVTNAEDRSRARVEAIHQFTAQKAEIIAAITLDTGRAPLSDVRIGVPAGYEVQTLTGPRVRAWHRDGGFVELRLDTQLDREAKLVLHLARTIDQPVSAWKLEPLRLPQFAKHEGVVFVAVHAADDVRLSFDGTDRKLREVDPATLPTVLSVASPFQMKRSLLVEKADWTAEITLARQAPRFSADTILLARAGDLGLSLSQQVGLVVEQGALGSVNVRLPKSLPEARVHGALVRDVRSKSTGEFREYEVSFQTDVLDRADFTMDFDLPLEGEKHLPSVKVDGAARIRRFVIADNAGAREMKLDAGGAAVAVKESLPYLPEGLVRPQYLRAGDSSSVKLAFTQLESTAGNAAIITLAEITTALRANGERWETVVYSLANRSLQFLPVKLPAGAELIEVSVGGQTVRADVEGGEKGRVKSERLYLVPLIQMRAGELSQQVKLVYFFGAGKGIEDLHKFRQPVLSGLSAERTLWNVWVPEKFAAKHFDGNMEEIGAEGSMLEKLQSDLSDVARLNRVLSSGDLSYEDAKAAWGNVNKKIAEVKKGQAESRSKKRGKLYESVDEAKGEKIGRAVSARDSDVEKQLEEQSVLIVSNTVNVERAQQKVPVLGDVPVNGRLFQGKGKEQALQNWDYNGSPVAGKKPGQQTLTQGYAQTGMVDLNDNVSLNGGEFFKRGIDLSGVSQVANQSGEKDGIDFIRETKTEQKPVKQEAAATSAITKTGSGTGKASVENEFKGNLSLGNARAGQIAQYSQQLANDDAKGGGIIMNYGSPIQSGGTIAFSGGTTVTAGALQSEVGRDKAHANDSGGFNDLNAPVPTDPFAPSSSVPPQAPNAKLSEMSQPVAKPASEAVGTLADADARRQSGMPPQLKPVGRVSLAVDVPLDGKVYHFSKLKDHASIEVKIVKPFDERQTGAMWALGLGVAVLMLFEFVRRAWGRRQPVAVGSR